MKAHWSAGYVVGLPIACVGILVVTALAVFLWRKGDDRRLGMMSDARIGAWVCTVIAALMWLGLPWAFWPWEAQYHRWVPTTGTVAVIGNRFTDGQITSDTSGTVAGDFIVQLQGSATRYDCYDSRCALVHPGDVVTLSCIREFHWAGLPGWNCIYAKDEGVQ